MGETSGDIAVRFIDIRSGEIIGDVRLPITQLPQTFHDSHTTFSIASQNWQVVEADPMTAEEFTQTGHLQLKVSKVTMMSPSDIKYSLPTLCDPIPIPDETSGRGDKNIFEIHWDLWRQREWISVDFLPEIDHELSAIEDIFENHMLDAGVYENLHVRTLIQNPIKQRISLQQVLEYFPPILEQFDGIAYLSEDKLIDGGFAFKVEGGIIYGIEQGDKVYTLAVVPQQDWASMSTQNINAMIQLMNIHHLFFIDWINVQRIEGSLTELQGYFDLFNLRGVHKY